MFCPEKITIKAARKVFPRCPAKMTPVVPCTMVAIVEVREKPLYREGLSALKRKIIGFWIVPPIVRRE